MSKRRRPAKMPTRWRSAAAKPAGARTALSSRRRRGASGPKIALVGAGGISFAHLDAYRKAGLDVRVICQRTMARREARRDQYIPTAEVTSDFAACFAAIDIDIVDITTHPRERMRWSKRR